MVSSAMILCGFLMVFAFPWVSTKDVQVSVAKSECVKFSEIACPCGQQGQLIMMPVKLCSVKDKYTGKNVCRPCVGENFKEIHCNKFEKCETCVAGLKKCFTCPPGKTGPFCTEKQDFIVHPINIRIPRGGYPSHEKRNLRDVPEGCTVPDSMETVEIDCTIWPERVKCKEICIFGYSFQDGPTREISCRYDEDEWKPSEFIECKAFLDCSVHLISAGDVFCTSGKVKSGTTCDITCLAYDEHEKVPKTQYECKGDGSWEPPLPFCAEKGKEQTTVAAPETTVAEPGTTVASPAKK